MESRLALTNGYTADTSRLTNEGGRYVLTVTYHYVGRIRDSPRFWAPIGAYVLGGIAVGSAIQGAGCYGNMAGPLYFGLVAGGLGLLASGVVSRGVGVARGPALSAGLGYGALAGVATLFLMALMMMACIG